MGAEEQGVAVVDLDRAGQLLALVQIAARARSCSLDGSYIGMPYGAGVSAVYARKRGTRATVSTPMEVTAEAAPADRTGRASASNR